MYHYYEFAFLQNDKWLSINADRCSRDWSQPWHGARLQWRPKKQTFRFEGKALLRRRWCDGLLRHGQQVVDLQCWGLHSTGRLHEDFLLEETLNWFNGLIGYSDDSYFKVFCQIDFFVIIPNNILSKQDHNCFLMSLCLAFCPHIFQ